MQTAPILRMRRALAALALLAILGAVVAPVCAEGMGERASPSHCNDQGGHGMPGDHAPGQSPVHHHSPALCATGMCTSAQFLTAPAVARQVAVVPIPDSVEPILVSTSPQHTTPPPRS